jgi:hypothetical protein
MNLHDLSAPFPLTRRIGGAPQFDALLMLVVPKNGARTIHPTPCGKQCF